MAQFNKLNTFSDDELIFDEEETIIILKFIFKSQHALIDGMEVNNNVREFAQALLVEAIDASAALWAIQTVFTSAISPGQSAKKVMSKMGKKAAKKWFKHASARDLKHVKIYEAIRNRLALLFTIRLGRLAAKLEVSQLRFSYPASLYRSASFGRVWRA